MPLTVAWDMLNRAHMSRGGPRMAGAGSTTGAAGPEPDGRAPGGNGAPAGTTATPPAEAGANR
jgi:hypothetical protein